MNDTDVSAIRAEVEARVLTLLRAGPVRQCDISDHVPQTYYSDIGYVMRDLDARGIVTREKSGGTYVVRLRENR